MKIKTVGIVNGCSGHWHQAAQEAGFAVLWDYEPSWQREVIEHNFDGKIYWNKYQVLNDETMFGADKPDLICGSPPCTGFTPAAGKAYRPELEINNYVVEFSKIVAKIKPKYFVMEQVKNFYLIENKFFKAYIKNIKKHYNYSLDIVNAFEYGSPQTRHRFVIAGALKPFPFGALQHNELFNSVNIKEEYPLHRLKNIVPVERIYPAKHLKGNWGCLSTPHRRDMRTLKPEVPCHVLTGFCTKDILIKESKKKSRFIAYNEAAALMGFPKNYDFGFLCMSKRGLAIGRGIPVELAKNLLLNMQKAVE